MLQENDLESLDDLAEEIIGRSEQSLREASAKVPRGTCRAETAIEQVGGQPDVVIQCAVSIEGRVSRDAAVCDYGKR